MDVLRTLLGIIVFCIPAAVALYYHFFSVTGRLIQEGKRTRFDFFFELAAFILTLVFFISIYQEPRSIPLWTFVALLFSYGAMLFIVLSETMLAGFAKYLTTRRGKKWVKELDYVYLAIGAIGIVFSFNRLPMTTHGIAGIDLLAPLILATAVVIRIIKTRAEIGEWSELPC